MLDTIFDPMFYQVFDPMLEPMFDPTREKMIDPMLCPMILLQTLVTFFNLITMCIKNVRLFKN